MKRWGVHTVYCVLSLLFIILFFSSPFPLLSLSLLPSPSFPLPSLSLLCSLPSPLPLPPPLLPPPLLPQAMLEDKLRSTDWEATYEAIEEAVARESYLTWLREQEKQTGTSRQGLQVRGRGVEGREPLILHDKPVLKGCLSL